MVFKKIFFSVLFLILSHSLIGQIGVIARYSSNNFSDWSGVTRAVHNGPIWENHLEFGLDYWFKPGEYRAEYLIELSYLSKTTSYGNWDYNLSGYTFGVKSNLYIFDFLGDCDCPTFKKEGGFFKKGFFLQWNAHAGYWQKDIGRAMQTLADPNVAIDFGIGAGIDIGISELLTISPVITYQYFPWLTWEQFSLNHGIGGLENFNAKITAGMFKVGVRIGFRPDFLKEQRVLNR